MKFRYYVTDLMDGMIKGTNSRKVAQTYAESEEYFVVDSETGEWFQVGSTIFDIGEIF